MWLSLLVVLKSVDEALVLEEEMLQVVHAAASLVVGVGREVSDVAWLGCFSTTSAGSSRRPCKKQ
jgi:hypothetical protein